MNWIALCSGVDAFGPRDFHLSNLTTASPTSLGLFERLSKSKRGRLKLELLGISRVVGRAQLSDEVIVRPMLPDVPDERTIDTHGRNTARASSMALNADEVLGPRFWRQGMAGASAAPVGWNVAWCATLCAIRPVEGKWAGGTHPEPTRLDIMLAVTLVFGQLHLRLAIKQLQSAGGEGRAGGVGGGLERMAGVKIVPIERGRQLPQHCELRHEP